MAGHPSWASGAPAQKGFPLLACLGSQLVLEGAQPAAGCSHTSVPWAHVVPCPPGSLQRIHPGALPAASALPGQPVTEPGVGWTLPSSPGVSASPPHALRTALSLGKVGPLGVVAVAVGGSHPQMSPVGPCANSRVRPTPGKVCVPLRRPDGMVPAWGMSGCPQGHLDAVLRGQSSGSGLGLSWERRLHAGSLWSPSSRLQEAPGLAALCCAVCRERGPFIPTPGPQLGACFWGQTLTSLSGKGHSWQGPLGAVSWELVGRVSGLGGKRRQLPPSTEWLWAPEPGASPPASHPAPVPTRSCKQQPPLRLVYAKKTFGKNHLLGRPADS